jgi:formylglycine-generating enzyme required for sulfatase activity
LKAGQRYRLPTDREWSLAVGLGEEKAEGPKKLNEAVRDVYPWGNDWPPPPKAGNFSGEETGLGDGRIAGYRDDFPRLAPVGSFSPNANGFYDLAGNVWQWCSDLFDPPNNPEMVVRGGAWDTSDRHELLSSHRGSQKPAYREWNLGFRCVLDLGLTNAPDNAAHP